VDSFAASPSRPVITVGHSNHELNHFLDLVREMELGVVVDVRSHPYSRFAGQFNREPLERSFAALDIRYLFLGRELGGRPEGAEFYDDEGHVLYGRVARSPVFLDGLVRLEQGLGRFRVAIVCSEEDPTDCHRRLLVGRVLVERGIEVLHLRGDGTIQTEDELGGFEQGNLFGGFAEEAWRSTRSVLLRRVPSSSSVS
jgi:uncharacterized protein (DUF488 family)